ncbi:DUF2256 domain-containing protein [Winogradskyella sp. F6397]|uniref:DUF2256 domain-containing protein n=1 Tax=Winogradskyella marina TaxID=2785530 RepID=A0ABS0EQ91_9FLAO|nr:DUF2256 domain-containing protein [Winogradskyella marina]MBF8150926.1 DUF2256 domain-containing protein [Winogradskyella marina]
MKGVKKENLPSKLCPVCQRPFAWRKKWERDWEDVKYCSDKCKKQKTIVI